MCCPKSCCWDILTYFYNRPFSSWEIYGGGLVMRSTEAVPFQKHLALRFSFVHSTAQQMYRSKTASAFAGEGSGDMRMRPPSEKNRFRNKEFLVRLLRPTANQRAPGRAPGMRILRARHLHRVRTAVAGTNQRRAKKKGDRRQPVPQPPRLPPATHAVSAPNPAPLHPPLPPPRPTRARARPSPRASSPAHLPARGARGGSGGS